MTEVYKNEVTNEEHDSPQERVEAVLARLLHIKQEMWVWSKAEKECLEYLNNLAQHPEVTKGTVTLDGTKQRAKITRRVNVSYPKPRGEEHPLRKLMTEYPSLGDMIRVDYKESGTKIEKLIDRVFSEKASPGDDIELATALKEVRVIKAGKPSIVVEDLEGEKAPSDLPSDSIAEEM